MQPGLIPQHIYTDAPLLLDRDNPLALFWGEDLVYHVDSEGQWTPFEGAQLPKTFNRFANDKAVLVPSVFYMGCI